MVREEEKALSSLRPNSHIVAAADSRIYVILHTCAKVDANVISGVARCVNNEVNNSVNNACYSFYFQLKLQLIIMIQFYPFLYIYIEQRCV